MSESVNSIQWILFKEAKQVNIKKSSQIQVEFFVETEFYWKNVNKLKLQMKKKIILINFLLLFIM